MATWEDGVRRVVPYTPGEQPKQLNVIKLNTNENPYPPSPKAMEALRNVSETSMRRYPDPAATELVEALAQRYGVKTTQVFPGVGSDDVLAMAFLTFFNTGRPILFPDITYSFYDVWADLFKIPYERIPLDADLKINPQDYARENGGVVIANPNAPTGVKLELAQIETILQANPNVVVIIDEAYVDFGADSALTLLDRYENLLVVQTSSKSRSMAGLRIGWAFGSEKMIGYLNACKYSFNSYTMNAPSIAAGSAAIRDAEYDRECSRKIIATRERMKKVFAELGFSFGDSYTNFLFVTHERVPAEQIFTQLKEKNIYVRYFKKPERISNYLRISIGTDEEMDKLVEELKTILAE